jgi:predicted homoserine dehydrogenase-like protein
MSKTNSATMTVNEQPYSLDVVIVHAKGTPVRAAHEAARAVKGVRLVSTFVDGWGRTVTMAIASNA